MTACDPLSRVRIVLSHPTHPGNIGAAARAIKTMGLSRLYLVRPKQFPAPEARAMSSNARNLLERAVLCERLEDALEGTALQVAVSARSREIAHPLLDARAAAAETVLRARTQEVAFVFGSEAAGLSNEEVMKCNRLAHIPANPDYSSLNLAAAVQVIAYECRLAAEGAAAGAVLAPESATELAGHADVEHFYAHLERSLDASGFLRPKYPRLMEKLRRLFSRVTLEKEEVSILRGMLSAWDKAREPD